MNIGNLTSAAALMGIDTSSLFTDTSAIVAAAQARKAAKTKVPTPWDSTAIAPDKAALVRSALAGKPIIDQTTKLSTSGSRDAQSLFSLYSGLQTLRALAEQASLKTISDTDRALLQKRLTAGVAEAQKYVDSLDLQKVALIKGDKLTTEDSALVLSKNAREYATGSVHQGAYEDPVAAFAGNVQFSVTLTRSTGSNVVNFDLAEMGATPRNMENVTAYINGKLDAAGAAAKFSAVRVGEPNEFGRIEADSYGFKITTIPSEKLTFAAPASTPALYVVGASGSGATASGRVTKVTDLSGAMTAEFAKTITPKDGAVTWRSSALAADGGLYVVGDTTVSLDGTPMKSDRDAVLAKYDSAGKLLWTKTIGAANDAIGYSVAVSDDGDVAVAGSTTGRIAADVKGASDSFVTVFDSAGVEQWTKQTATLSDDQALSVAFDDSGRVVLAGRTKGALVAGGQQGGWDNYLEVLDTAGAVVSRRQFGAASDDLLGGLALTGDGNVIVSSIEDGRAILRKYDITGAANGAPVWTQDIGDPGVGGNVSAIAYKDGAIYVGGRASSASFAAAQGGDALAGGEDGWLARFDDGPSSATQVWGRFLGTAGADQVRGITLSDDSVWATGDVSGQLAGATQLGDRDSFAASFSLAAGAQTSAVQFSGHAGLASGAAIVFDPNGQSTLDLLGLPSGALNTPRSTEITARSNARVGDYFYVTVNGGSKRRVIVEDGDTWLDLSFKINTLIGFNGRAAVRTTGAGESLRVEARGTGLIEFSPGETGRDALAALGLKIGTAYDATAENSGTTSSSAPRVIALGLDSKWSLATPADAVKTRDTIDKIFLRVKTAYGIASGDPAFTPTGIKKPGKTGGTVPAYMTKQISAYTAALQRLTGGG